jgi:hypothetical protein
MAVRAAPFRYIGMQLFIYVTAHKRYQHGKIIWVRGYWRKVTPRERKRYQLRLPLP